ncbi:alkyl hydroperoxide reductase subunit F [Thalassotalea euphylliae]|uniref:Alkyl hydroperoxide reductase subunit F n=1 Tax=Thalassotalea euphylliae TaxID=1655234 RepID=A0A3E0TPD2_9GAMM|nr:alkyl hydroperoxide reductase subunit F [Thalassotalea euphylliae]REL26409.1 alkyl hydroperoxide reductase subunit F [Thalassotalea euphylliae]
MLNSDLKTQLKTYLANIKKQVTLSLALDDSAKSQELKQLAEDIASLSTLITIENSTDAAARKPSMTVISETGTKLAFAGIPLGHEFTSLVLALLHSGGHPIKVSEEEIEQIKSLEGEFHFDTYISLSCQNCPDVVQALNIMAAINPQITSTMIDGGLFEQEVKDRNIMAVPSVYLNGESFGQGRMSLTDILKKVDKNADAKQAQKLNEKEAFDVLIVGGGPAGASAAVYAARKGIKTGIVADRFGGQVLETVGIENFISVKKTEGPKLVASLEEHVKDYDVDIMTGAKGVKLSKDELVSIELDNGATLKSKSVIVATGARWRKMNVPGEAEYSGSGVAYCPHCDGPLFKGKKVAVIGGGNSGIEAAIDLAGIVEHVTVLEFDSKLRADEVLQRKAKSMGNITILTQAQTTEVLGDGNKVTGLAYTDRATGDSHELELAGIFVQIGLVPNAEWLDGDIDLTNRGEIIVNERGETSMPGVFAAGDVTTSPYKQIVIAMGNGANASLAAFDYLIRQVEETSDEAAEKVA